MFGFKFLVVVTAVSLLWNIERTRSQSSNEQHVVCSNDFRFVARNLALSVTSEQYVKIDNVANTADCQELCVATRVHGKPCKSLTSSGHSCSLSNINSTEAQGFVYPPGDQPPSVIMDRLCSVCEFRLKAHNEILVLTRDQFIWLRWINSALECQKLCTRGDLGFDCKSVTFYTGIYYDTMMGCELNTVNSSEASLKPKPSDYGGDTDVYDLHCPQ